MLADRRRTAEQVALELGFPSGASFRNMLQRYMRTPLAVFRSRDGLERALELFAAALELRIANLYRPTTENLKGRALEQRAV